jgi:hypothetical protein
VSVSAERGPPTWHKRPTNIAKEACYYHAKGGLLANAPQGSRQCQKRLTCHNTPCYYGKRGTLAYGMPYLSAEAREGIAGLQTRAVAPVAEFAPQA